MSMRASGEKCRPSIMSLMLREAGRRCRPLTLSVRRVKERVYTAHGDREQIRTQTYSKHNHSLFMQWDTTHLVSLNTL